jgi:hypothetical protein
MSAQEAKAVNAADIVEGPSLTRTGQSSETEQH